MLDIIYIQEQKKYSAEELLGILGGGDSEKKILAQLIHDNVVIHTARDDSDYDDEDAIATSGKFCFRYVGIVDCKKSPIICYPKYMNEGKPDVLKIKNIINALAHYSQSQQNPILVSDDTDSIGSRFSLIVWLLRDYMENGIYRNLRQVSEYGGVNEIDWDMTISEVNPVIKNKRPFYFDYWTTETVVDDSDFITRLHIAMISKYSNELKESGLDSFLSIDTYECLCDEKIEDLGSEEYLLERLNNELSVQFVTRKQHLIKNMIALLSNSTHAGEYSELEYYGTRSFHVVWEKACANFFGNRLDDTIVNISEIANFVDESKRYKTLLELIPPPRWNIDNVVRDAPKTLRPDAIMLYHKPDTKQTVFFIMDAKYYNLYGDLNGVHNTPGVEDVGKQFIYQKAYGNIITASQGAIIPRNAFLIPGDLRKLNGIGNVEFSVFAGCNDVEVIRLDANRILANYANGIQIEQNDFPLIHRNNTLKCPNIRESVNASKQD